jgi:hypothetical protein
MRDLQNAATLAMSSTRDRVVREQHVFGCGTRRARQDMLIPRAPIASVVVWRLQSRRRR